jgi:hypothetical protein
MTTAIRFRARLLALAAAALALSGCTKDHRFKELDVDGVVQLQSTAPVTFMDANTEEFRKENGIITGARLLSSASKYDPAKELPPEKDTRLVFYCSNRL